MRLIKKIFTVLMIMAFLAGLGILLYPILNGILTDNQIRHDAELFLSRIELEPYHSAHVSQVKPEAEPVIPEPTEPDTNIQLWRDMMEYNQDIFQSGQEDLDCKLAYEQPSFVLKEYGLETEIFAVISIPKLELEMPVYLGADYNHMANGTAILSQTSIPIGGQNTNCIIAGHRGWNGASYFRYIDELEPGDTVTITNLWESLHYEVSQIQIIQPNEVEEIKIKPNQEIITLLTCHPYASGGRQRYLVICERTNYEPTSAIDR